MATPRSTECEPIAIVGMGCRLPGGVQDIPALWEFLRDQKDAHGEFVAPRFSAQGFYHANSDRPGTAVASSGFLLEEDPRLFDPSFFGITEVEAETMDASQRKLLEVTYEAFENAGETWDGVSGSRIGVFVGDISFDNYVSQTRDWDYSGKYSATGAFPNMLANRIHYVFNLKGPSLLINSACTSAMYALHLAITSMRNGDCDSAIVAGSNWVMDPNCHIAMGKLGALSPSSRSHTFDASADGYARGEGFAALYLKTASLATQDASPIRALIRGSAVNANGRTSGITNPSGPAQETVIREAYKNAGGLDPSETTLLECHGTGTRVGDPIEVKAAGNVFGPSRSSVYEDRLVVGSVKTNVGHLEGACALPGILKVVASLEAGEIPATLGFQTPNPRIDFDQAKARVVSKTEPWPKDRLKRASVTSAGFGGTNGHCIIDHVHNVIPDYVKPGIIHKPAEKANGTNGHAVNGTNGTNGSKSDVIPLLHRPVISSPTMVRRADATTRQMVVLPFSAHNQSSLMANMEALHHALPHHSLADVAYTLAAKRSRFSQRAFSIVDRDQVSQDGPVTDNEPKVFASPQRVNVGFVFTGQGAQWPAMGAELFEYAVFKDTIAYLDTVLAVLPQPAPWKLVDILCGNCDKDLIQKPAVSQTVCTALQIGLVDLLASWSVRPAGVVGHSSGEMAAAYAAGRITAAEAITIAYYRGYMVSFNQKKGAMLAVGFGADQGAEYIRHAGMEDRVKVAAINSPASITMSGDADAIEQLSVQLTHESIFNRQLRTGGLAYHSHHMLSFGHDYAKAINDGLQRLASLGINDATHRYPNIPWVSSVLPHKNTTMPREDVTASYWQANLESPVRFTDAVSKLLDMEDMSIGVTVEIGPHPALKGPLGQIVKGLGRTLPHVASVERGQDARRSLLGLAGTLFALNADIDLVAVNAVDASLPAGERALAHGCMAIDLPPYRYTYGPIKYHESRLSKEYRLRRWPRHDLLGARVAGTTRLRPQWRNILRLKDLPWLNDHRVPPHVLHPGAAHIVMAMLAAEQAYAEFPDALPIVGLTLRNVSIKKTLVVPQDDKGIEIVLSMELEDGATATSPGWASFSIASVVHDTEQWTEHCSGLVKVEVTPFNAPAPIDTSTMDGRAVDAQAWYTRFADMGLQFGPSFQGYSDIWADPFSNVALAKLSLNTTAGLFPGGESSYPIHPASLDLVIRLGLMACNGGQAETASVQLPIHFDQMRFKLGCLQGRDWITGASRGELCGLRGAYAQLQLLDDAGEAILDVDNMRFTSLNNEQQSSAQDLSSQAYSSPFARLVWRPDSRTLSRDQWTRLLSSVDTATSFSRLSYLFDLVGHANPDLRILHLNAGGEGRDAVQAVLKTLVGHNGIKRYKEYAVTDASAERIDSVRESTSEFRGLTYSVLDINKDLSEQGVQLGTYDIILWSNAEHGAATEQALTSTKKLLQPGGHLVLVDHTDSSDLAWDQCLLRTGFEPGVKVACCEVNPYSKIILSTLPDSVQSTKTGNCVVHLLHGSQGTSALLHHLARAMEQRGLSTRISPLDQAVDVVAPNSRVVAFLDGEHLLFAADQRRLGLFQHLAANTASMVWVTTCGLVKGRNPDGAFVSGLLRTLGTENPAGQFLSVDIDAEDFQVPGLEMDELVRCLVEQELLLQPTLDNNGPPEVNRDLVWQDGTMWTSRIVPDGQLQGYAEVAPTRQEVDVSARPLSSLGPVRAAFETPGILTSLYFRPYTELLQPLPRDYIDVKVDAVGLNWKDLGLCSGRFDANNLSNEYCGVVTQTGADVTGIAVGDRVYGMGKGHFGTYTRVPAGLAHKLAADVNSIEAATMPLVYMTAVYAFEHVTRLRPGQKVLIQSATGGLGLAAIQLARSKGATIYATAGTPDKVQFLTTHMGIPASQIFSSRDVASLHRAAQQHGGFDVILSTAQGDMLYESVKALAPLGHLVDVGRLDVTSSQTIGLELFQKSAGFTSFDLGLVVERDPGLGAELMQAVDAHFRAGRIGPIKPYSVADIGRLDQTLLQFSQGTHIGKRVITYQDPTTLLRTLPTSSAPPARFDPAARYILVGGLTGLGRSIVRWMSSRGARDMEVWSRRGASNFAPEAQRLITELAAQGIRVQPVACDVTNREAVLHAMQAAHADPTRPVRGVFHFAVSYQDISFDKMTEAQFHQGMAAKVFGVKHLHDATVSIPLDFFTMTSSLGTVYAFPTQSTYLAANNYLDYFARYRRRLGLPATTVALGFINDLGPLTNDPVTVNLFVRAKGQTMTGAQVVRMLEPAFTNDRPDALWLGHTDDPLSASHIVTGIDPAVLAKMARSSSASLASSTIPRWYHDPRVSLMLRALDDASSATSSSLSSTDTHASDASPTAQLRRQFDHFVTAIRAGGKDSKEDAWKQTIGFVTEAIRATVAGMLFVDVGSVNPNKTVAEHGIDSLLAAEFRNWFQGAFGRGVSMLELMDARMSLEMLARSVVEGAVGV
ncbi:type I Iterative Polyketide synthase (PKS) [Aspergillus brasiliensis]|uniref:Type I Iterative Polyketide synthase (PKS) n=1 Tax=Aspergillus brasiliensis TaxID=319629 RepID=A0A9W6DRU2_9EURO|nr:type I Iterative Polyketide synthase (PKS) [Aspergillus brasiliensis]GKZ48549.1 type I Iterative Polyketide synthase (PKS) [Aspergillus brasiliensis]